MLTDAVARFCKLPKRYAPRTSAYTCIVGDSRWLYEPVRAEKEEMKESIEPKSDTLSCGMVGKGSSVQRELGVGGHVDCTYAW